MRATTSGRQPIFPHICLHWIRTEMSKREGLKKLSKQAIIILAEEHGIKVKKRKKEDMISDILTAETPDIVLTPVVYQDTGLQAFTPQTKENLPPFNKVMYSENAVVPKLTFNNIYNFMISRPTVSGDRVNNFKGLDRAVKHFEAGDLQDIGYAKIDSSVVYVKATCQASMKKIKYQVYVCILCETDDSVIQYAYCQCPIGLAQSCSHIGGLLFALSNARTGGDVPKEKDQPSCTSRLCQWNVPRITVKPQPISLLSTKKNEQQVPEPETISNFDPRHTSDRIFDANNNLQHLRSLKDIFPNTGMSHLWNIPDHVRDMCEEVEVCTIENPLFTKMQNMLYSKENVPPLNIDQELVQYIERYTTDQRLSEMWKKLHVGRLTSSIFGAVLSSRDNPRSLVQQITEGSSLIKYKSLPPAVQWGVDNESKARSEYINLKQCFCENFKVEETGLTLLETHSFIGASSDGKVTEDGSVGVLEIKCPYSIQGKLVNKMEVLDIVSMNHVDFCLETSMDGVRLKKNHKYYAQVQGEMAVMSLPWCDFVVWTAAPRITYLLTGCTLTVNLSKICYQNWWNSTLSMCFQHSVILFKWKCLQYYNFCSFVNSIRIANISAIILFVYHTVRSQIHTVCMYILYTL